MRLLRTNVEELVLENFFDEYKPNPTKYAILSHTWLAEEEEEVKFADRHLPIEELRARKGWSKVEGSKRQALKDGWQYIWIDTLCIDKSSSTELGEAINSMYRWYEKSQACYVYIPDLPDPTPIEGNDETSDQDAVRIAQLPGSDDMETNAHSEHKAHASTDVAPIPANPGPDVLDIKKNPVQSPNRPSKSTVAQPKHLTLSDGKAVDLIRFRACKWFTCGWTLQELLAPRKVFFFSTSWVQIESQPLLREIENITGIHLDALSKDRHIETYSIAQRMFWAANRTTTRIEDRSYSLLGIFQINMTVMYGEGSRAFRRLQEELMRTSQDQTIFAFGLDSKSETPPGLLAKSPGDFASSGTVIQSMMRDTYYHRTHSRVQDV